MRNTIVLERNISDDFRDIKGTKNITLCGKGMTDVLGTIAGRAKKIRVRLTLKKRKRAIQIDLARYIGLRVSEVWKTGKGSGQSMEGGACDWLTECFSDKTWDRFSFGESDYSSWKHLTVWASVEVLEKM